MFLDRSIHGLQGPFLLLVSLGNHTDDSERASVPLVVIPDPLWQLLLDLVPEPLDAMPKLGTSQWYHEISTHRQRDQFAGRDTDLVKPGIASGQPPNSPPRGILRCDRHPSRLECFDISTNASGMQTPKAEFFNDNASNFLQRRPITPPLEDLQYLVLAYQLFIACQNAESFRLALLSELIQVGGP